MNRFLIPQKEARWDPNLIAVTSGNELSLQRVYKRDLAEPSRANTKPYFSTTSKVPLFLPGEPPQHFECF